MKRRDFLRHAAITPLAAALARRSRAGPAAAGDPATGDDSLTLFLAGDVMTGRAIDQVLPNAGDPRIHEPYSRSALDYLRLAERASGRIPRPVDYDYLWGDALAVLDASAAAVRIINLETAVTRRGMPWPGKAIQYRMHPDNLPCLAAAGIDCCVLANNHVLDWGQAGLEETLASLDRAGIAAAGAGLDRTQARAPAVLPLPDNRRVLVYACGLRSSGIPAAWGATAGRAGVNLLPDLSGQTLAALVTAVEAHRHPGDRVVISLHWGGNWGYAVPDEHRRFAHALIDAGVADIVHGHSSHHPLGIELYRGRPVLYGCGDLIDDYEGISRYADYRPDLALLYLASLSRTTGELRRLEMVPMRRRRFRLEHAGVADREWLQQVLVRECGKLATGVTVSATGSLLLALD